MVSPLDIADVVELRAWGSGQSLTLSELESDIETDIPEESIDVKPDDAGEPYEVLAQQVFDEILERQATLGGTYPFACDGYRVRYIPSQTSAAYIFCLLLSYLPADLISGDQRAIQFETLAKEAAQNFFGGSAVRIGWPWEKSTHAELLQDVVALLPNLGQVNPLVPVIAGDRGWDILVVKGFSDNHYPKLIALGNCATGRSNWKIKGLETSPEFFWQCFQHSRPGTWLTFTAVPFRMDTDSRDRKGSQTNLTFDRYRICEHAGILSAATIQWISQQSQNALDVPLDASV